MNKFSSNRIPIIFLLATILVVFLSVNSYLQIDGLISKSDKVNHSTLVKLQLNNIYISCSEADSDARSYLYTQDTTFIERMLRNEFVLESQMSHLEKLVQKHSTQAMNFQVLTGILKLRQTNRNRIVSANLNNPVTREQWIEGRQNMYQLRNHINHMLTEEEVLNKESNKTLQLATRNTPLFSIFLTCAALIILAITYWTIVRELRISNKLRRELESSEQHLLESNQTLKEQNEALDKMNKELESFTYISSHDLQEPLRKIQTFISRIDLESDNISETDKMYLLRTQDAAKRMQTLIQDLLAYSRVSKEHALVSEIDFKKWADAVCEELHEKIVETKTKISIKGNGLMNVNELQFNQLLLNLLTNAIKFIPQGRIPKIEISYKEHTGVIIEGKKSNQRYSILSVKDNGIGIEPQYHQRIFEVFQRLHTREEFSGTGVGLAIVKKIVDNHQGSIEILSKSQKGSEFIIYWPKDMN